MGDAIDEGDTLLGEAEGAVEREGGDGSGEENEEGQPCCPSEEIAAVGDNRSALVPLPHLPGAEAGREGADGIG